MSDALLGLAALADAEGDPEVSRVLRAEAAMTSGGGSGEFRSAHAVHGRGSPPPDAAGHTTAQLLALSRQGDARARSRLAARYMSVLRRFGHGRLPSKVRGVIDTDDLVQLTIERALARLDEFEPRNEGAFLAYLRRILVNQVRDEIRRAARGPAREPLDDDIRDPRSPPPDAAAEREVMEHYERCLARLAEDQRAAIVMRLELGMSYAELAQALGSRSVDAARMVLRRAVAKLSGLMAEGLGPGA